MIRMVPVYRYQETESQGRLLTAFRNWLHTLKIILFLILSIVFIFSIGAGWGIMHCHENQGAKIHKVKHNQPN